MEDARTLLIDLCAMARHQVCHYQDQPTTPPSGCGKCSACKLRLEAGKILLAIAKGEVC